MPDDAGAEQLDPDCPIVDDDAEEGPLDAVEEALGLLEDIRERSRAVPDPNPDRLAWDMLASSESESDGEPAPVPEPPAPAPEAVVAVEPLPGPRGGDWLRVHTAHATFALDPYTSSIGCHCRRHPKCVVNRVARKRPVGFFLAWLDAANDPEFDDRERHFAA
eukprot:4337379-Lingulodinium_polyedra.AAC.1